MVKFTTFIRLFAVALFLNLSACDSSFAPSGSTSIIYTGFNQVPNSPGLPSLVAASRPSLSGPFLSAASQDASLLISDGSQSLFYNAANDSWMSAGAHATSSNSTLTRMSDNRILAAGGLDGSYNGLTTVSIYDPQSNQWMTAPSLLVGQGAHSAISLTNGSVMVAGGATTAGVLTDATEIFDGSTWHLASPMNVARGFSILAGLPDGRVVAAGGYDGTQYLVSTEIFNPVLNQWSMAGDMPVSKFGEAYASLTDGRVVSVGGVDLGNIPLHSAEIFDPTANAWSALPPMAYSRKEHTLGVLPDGRLIVAGGWGENGGSSGYLDSTEIFDPSTLSWSAGPAMSDTRGDHAMSISPDGRVFLFGGRYSTVPLASTEILDPFPTKVALTSAGGSGPYTYSKLSGPGFVYQQTYYTGQVCNASLKVRDSRGFESVFTIRVY